MNLEFSEEQKFVQQSVRDFLTKNAVCPACQVAVLDDCVVVSQHCTYRAARALRATPQPSCCLRSFIATAHRRGLKAP